MPNINIKEHECAIDEAVALMEILSEQNDAVMLWGTYGIGKSGIVHQLGTRTKRKVITFMLSIREPVDMRGIPVINQVTKTTDWYSPSELPNVERDGEEGYLFLDEINTAPQMMPVAMQLVLDRKVGDYVLPKGWRIIAAGNRVGDRAAAQRMPTALRNRFAHIFIKPDVKAWCNWAVQNLVPAEVIAFVRLKQTIHVQIVGDENATLTPRSLCKAAQYVNAPKQHRMRLFAAHIGDAYAGELDAFIDLYRNMGSLEDIIANPKNAKVPTDPSLRFAVCTGLGKLATRKNFSAVVEYAQRLPRESEMMTIHDATLRDASLKNTAIYGKWAVANQDLTIQ